MAKLLFVSAEGDYDATSFENQFGSLNVSDVIKRVEAGEKFRHEECEYDFDLRVFDVGDVPAKFIDFVRDTLPYPKEHSNFYLDNEQIRG